MIDINTILDNVSKIFFEIVTSLYSIVEKIFQTQMLQSILNILKGIGLIMVAIVEVFLKVLKMIIH